jgi:hypothetical protein
LRFCSSFLLGLSFLSFSFNGVAFCPWFSWFSILNNVGIYKNISDEMAEKGYDKSSDQCKVRMKNEPTETLNIENQENQGQKATPLNEKDKKDKPNTVTSVANQ